MQITTLIKCLLIVNCFQRFLQLSEGLCNGIGSDRKNITVEKGRSLNLTSIDDSQDLYGFSFPSARSAYDCVRACLSSNCAAFSWKITGNGCIVVAESEEPVYAIGGVTTENPDWQLGYWTDGNIKFTGELKNDSIIVSINTSVLLNCISSKI